MTATTPPRHRAEVRRITRNNWTIMAAGLWAGIFKRNPTPANLTRWADLTQEVDAA